MINKKIHSAKLGTDEVTVMGGARTKEIARRANPFKMISVAPAIAKPKRVPRVRYDIRDCRGAEGTENAKRFCKGQARYQLPSRKARFCAHHAFNAAKPRHGNNLKPCDIRACQKLALFRAKGPQTSDGSEPRHVGYCSEHAINEVIPFRITSLPA